MHIRLIPAFADNYLFLLVAEDGRAGVIDPGDAAPVLAVLNEAGLALEWIWLTHHHADHIGGVAALRAATGCRVAGFTDDAHRLPPLDLALKDGDRIEMLGVEAQVLHVPGHTLGHIAYFLPEIRSVFCGDTLFVSGCGRLFEGTPAQMFASLARLAALPDDTQVFCAHEYAETNSAFALSVMPDNPLLEARAQEIRRRRAKGLPTVPTTIATEKRANLFLRAGNAEAFAALRARRDTW